MRSHGRRSALSRSRLAMTVGASVAALALGACGDDDDSGDSASTGANTEAAAAGGGALADAKKVVAMSDGKLVYSAQEEPSGAGDIEEYGDWRGPTSAPKAEQGKNLQIIVCTKGSPACLEAGEGAVEAAKELGWKAEIIDGKGTPQGFAGAFDTAMQRKADAIITVAIPTAAVGNKIEETKKAGIVTVATGDREPDSGTKYDAYVPFPMPLMNTVLAYADIAKTGGKSKSIVVEDPGFPVLIQSAAQYRKIIETCDECEAIQQKMQITDAVDPTKAATITRSAITKNPDATTLVLPYAIPLPAVVQSVESEGKDVAILAKDADPVGLKAVADGSSLYNAGSSVVWAGWAAVDQALRGVAEDTYLGPTETGIGVALFSKENAPKDGDIESFEGLVDYKGKYREIWGAGA